MYLCACCAVFFLFFTCCTWYAKKNGNHISIQTEILCAPIISSPHKLHLQGIVRALVFAMNRYFANVQTFKKKTQGVQELQTLRVQVSTYYDPMYLYTGSHACLHKITSTSIGTYVFLHRILCNAT